MRSRTPSAWLADPRVCRRSGWARGLSPLSACVLFAGSAAAAPTGNGTDGHGAETPLGVRDATETAAPQQAPVAACAGDVRLFLELSVMGLLTVGLAAAVLRGASHCRRPRRRPQQRQDTAAAAAAAAAASGLQYGDAPPWASASRFTGAANTPRCRILAAVARVIAALSVGSWGVLGFVFAASTTADAARSLRQTPPTHECDGWEAGAAVATGCCCLIAALWLLVSLATDALKTSLIRPPNETPVALKCFRCSCCSFALARALVLLAIAAASALAVRSWLQARASPVSECEPKIAALFSGAALVFGLMAATTASVVIASALGNRCARSSSASACCGCTAHASTAAPCRQTPRLLVASALASLALGAVMWGVIGLLWLSAPLPVDKPACTLDSETESTLDDAKVCVVALLVVGTGLLVMTVCCRLENFFLETGATPTVDALMLSPSLGTTSRAERVIGPPPASSAKINRKVQSNVATLQMLAIV